MNSLCFSDATELASKIRNKEMSSIELLNHYKIARRSPSA